MHHIQYGIIAELMIASTRRFSELKPAGVESNLFQYHLKHVIKEGYVEKVTGGYRLSPKGLYFADRHSPSLRTVREQPKIITMIILNDAKGRVLLKQKIRQPFVSTYHLPAGKIHENESLAEAAARELHEKTGLDEAAINLNHIATVHVRIRQDNELVSEYFGFAYQGLINQSIDGAVWYDTEKADEYQLAPSVRELLELSRAPTAQPQEFIIDL